jgi:fructan beta-fructosidase
MPFNQQMSFPVRLMLRRFPEGLRLTEMPVDELSLLHDRYYVCSGIVDSSIDAIKEVTAGACEIRATIEPGDAKLFALNIRGFPVTYETSTRQLAIPRFSHPLPYADGKLRLVILVDRTSIEVFAQDGRIVLAECFLPSSDEPGITMRGPGAKVESLECWSLKSCWRDSPRTDEVH